MSKDNDRGGPGQTSKPCLVTTGNQAPPSISTNLLECALKFHRKGFCVVPQWPGSKSPCVKWKPYQDERPTVGLLYLWFGRRFLDAGIALILGPVSGLLVVDVDGDDANRVLVDRLGGVPDAPTVLSGSHDPHRFHLYFQHPEFPTQATYHPWHSALEFRGHRGIVIAPPSLHKSGNRYRWAEGKSLDDLPLPPLPAEIHEALAVKASLRPRTNPRKTVLASLPAAQDDRQAYRIGLFLDLTEKTRDFLAGRFAAGPNWNSRLFAAACDMCGCDYPLDEALPLLLRGARPWTGEDR